MCPHRFAQIPTRHDPNVSQTILHPCGQFHTLPLNRWVRARVVATFGRLGGMAMSPSYHSQRRLLSAALLAAVMAKTGTAVLAAGPPQAGPGPAPDVIYQNASLPPSAGTTEQIVEKLDARPRALLGGSSTEHEAAAMNELGVALVFQGHLDQAIVEFQKATQLQPDNFSAHLNLANSLLDKGRLDDALAEFQTALQLRPESAKAHNDFGVALKAMEDLTGAIMEFRRALRLQPNDAHAHNNLGVALKAMGDLEGAITEYRTALALSPEDVNARFNLGLALLQKGDLPNAADEFRTAIRLRPHDAKARYNLGTVLTKMGQRSEAAREFRKYLRLELETPVNQRWIEEARTRLAELEHPQAADVR